MGHDVLFLSLEEQGTGGQSNSNDEQFFEIKRMNILKYF